jgi:UDP-N-acetyl-D-mannosaminuronic acid dehydrogenase
VVFLGLAEAISIADIVLLLVNHDVFKIINIKDLGGKLVIDTRGLWKVN